jgi:hypothetical protein
VSVADEDERAHERGYQDVPPPQDRDRRVHGFVSL